MRTQGSAIDLADLLSVDVDAELRQLASRRLRAPQLFVVELMRAASKRGAREILVTHKKDRVLWRDDGQEITNDAIQALACVLDAQQDASQRQQAVELLESPQGQGLLFCMSASPSWIGLRCGDQLWSWRKGRGDGGSESSWQKTGPGGPRIELRGVTTERLDERAALIDHGAFASVRVHFDELELPGADARMLGSRLVHMQLGQARVQLGLPRDGDLCRLSLLRDGVVVRTRAAPPQQGLIFELAIEDSRHSRLSQVLADSTLLPTFLDQAAAVLKDFADRYWQLDRSSQQRIQELIFCQARATGDMGLCDRAALFVDLRSGSHLGVQQLREMSQAGLLLTVDAGQQNRVQVLGEQRLVALDVAQTLFLREIADIDLCPAPALARPAFSPLRILRSLSSKILAVFLLPHRPQILSAQQLGDDEQQALLILRDALQATEFVDRAGHAITQVQIAPGRGWRAAHFSQTGHTRSIVMRRRHPLVKALITAVIKDARLVRLALPAILAGYDGWVE